MKMIRISEDNSSRLDSIADESGLSKQELMDKAIRMLAADYFFKKADEAYARLKNDPVAWQEELDERKLWESTGLDGLSNDD